MKYIRKIQNTGIFNTAPSNGWKKSEISPSLHQFMETRRKEDFYTNKNKNITSFLSSISFFINFLRSNHVTLFLSNLPTSQNLISWVYGNKNCETLTNIQAGSFTNKQLVVNSSRKNFLKKPDLIIDCFSNKKEGLNEAVTQNILTISFLDNLINSKTPSFVVPQTNTKIKSRLLNLTLFFRLLKQIERFNTSTATLPQDTLTSSAINNITKHYQWTHK